MCAQSDSLMPATAGETIGSEGVSPQAHQVSSAHSYAPARLWERDECPYPSCTHARVRAITQQICCVIDLLDPCGG